MQLSDEKEFNIRLVFESKTSVFLFSQQRCARVNCTFILTILWHNKSALRKIITRRSEEFLAQNALACWWLGKIVRRGLTEIPGANFIVEIT